MTTKGSTVILDAVGRLHERGLQGVRVRANFYATGHWRCRVYVSHPGEDPRREGDILVAYTSGRDADLCGDGRIDWTADTFADELAHRSEQYPDAARSDSAYVRWFSELRMATGPDGVLALWDDYENWESAGHVAVIRAQGDARDGKAHFRLPPPP